MAALVQRRFHELHDTNSRAYFLFVSSARWLGFRLDAICSVLLIAGTFAAVAAKHAAGGVLGGGDNPGLIGAALVFLVRLAGLFQWFVRQTAEFENQMVSVERLLAYARLPQEPPLASDTPPPAAWPQRGALVLKDVSMRYRPGLAPALRGVSFAVAPGSLVGVCGRTGAGKSSLLAALFRLSEPHEGAPAHAPRPCPSTRPLGPSLDLCIRARWYIQARPRYHRDRRRRLRHRRPARAAPAPRAHPAGALPLRGQRRRQPLAARCTHRGRAVGGA